MRRQQQAVQRHHALRVDAALGRANQGCRRRHCLPLRRRHRHLRSPDGKSSNSGHAQQRGVRDGTVLRPRSPARVFRGTVGGIGDPDVAGVGHDRLLRLLRRELLGEFAKRGGVVPRTSGYLIWEPGIRGAGAEQRVVAGWRGLAGEFAER